MNCPSCRNKIVSAVVFSRCRHNVKIGNKIGYLYISEWEPLMEKLEVLKIKCSHCYKDITDLVDKEY